LEAVVEEDVSKARRDDSAETIFFQRPRRVFATGAATKVFPGEQYAGALITCVIEHEIRIQRTLGVVLIRLPDIQVTPFIEQVRAEARALDRLQELLGNDLIGIDVGTIQRSDKAGVLSKSFHAGLLSAESSHGRRRNDHSRRLRQPSPG